MELVQYLFTVPGVSAFLSNKICQDKLENFFGQQRQRGRVHENPNARDFLKNTQALRVVNGIGIIRKGNCRGAPEKRLLAEIDLEMGPLPKRKYKH